RKWESISGSPLSRGRAGAALKLKTWRAPQSSRGARLVAADRLADLKTLELRVIEIKRLVLAGPRVRRTERLGFGPGLERRLALPYRVRGIERVVLPFRPAQ